MIPANPTRDCGVSRAPTAENTRHLRQSATVATLERGKELSNKSITSTLSRHPSYARGCENSKMRNADNFLYAIRVVVSETVEVIVSILFLSVATTVATVGKSRKLHREEIGCDGSIRIRVPLPPHLGTVFPVLAPDGSARLRLFASVKPREWYTHTRAHTLHAQDGLIA